MALLTTVQIHLNSCLWILTNLSANVSWPDKERSWLMQAVEMDTFILISPGGISEGTRPEGPGKTPPGKAITASPLPPIMHAIPLRGKERAPRCPPMYVGPRGLLTFATHTHAYTQKEGRKDQRERERGGKGLLDILQCRPPPAVMELPHPLCGGGSLLTVALLACPNTNTLSSYSSSGVDGELVDRPSARARPRARPATLGSHSSLNKEL